MGLETASNIDQLNTAWPLGSDPIAEADNHLRLLKTVLQNDIRAIYPYQRVHDFVQGAVVTINQVLWDPASSQYYHWNGVYPPAGYIVPPGSTPASTGGIGPSAWSSVGNASTTQSGLFVPTTADIPSTLAVGTVVYTQGRYTVGKGAGRYIITSGTTPYPLVDPQIVTGKYAKLLPNLGTNYCYSLLAAGAKDNLTIDDSTSDAINQLLAKIWNESPVFGGLIQAEAGQFYLKKGVVRPADGCKQLGMVGEYSHLSYGTFESKTIFYFDNNIVGGQYAFDFFDCTYMTFSDFALRGDVSSTPIKGGLRLGKDGAPSASGKANHLVERVQITNCTDCLLIKNSGITTLRDIQIAKFQNRGVTLETSGDSNLYNIYVNDGNKDTTDTSLLVGTALYIGYGSNNVNIFGGKLEYNSKGLVSHGSNGVTAIGVQFDYNKMANHILRAIDDGTNACRGNSSVGCRYLSGGVIAGFQKAGIYLDSTSGAVFLSLAGGCLQAAGDGAFDTSTTGLIGPEVGIYALGNSTYPLQVHGDGLILDRPGTVYGAVASGFGTRIKLSGSGTKKTTQELSNGKCHIGFYEERSDAIAFKGTSGSAPYSTAVCETVVIDGIAYMDITLAVNGAPTLSGNLTIGDLPFTNTSGQQASVSFGMISSINNTPTGMLGYVDPGSNQIILWKRQTNGDPARLPGIDINNSSLLRISLRMKVA